MEGKGDTGGLIHSQRHAKAICGSKTKWQAYSAPPIWEQSEDGWGAERERRREKRGEREGDINVGGARVGFEGIWNKNQATLMHTVFCGLKSWPCDPIHPVGGGGGREDEMAAIGPVYESVYVQLNTERTHNMAHAKRDYFYHNIVLL